MHQQVYPAVRTVFVKNLLSWYTISSVRLNDWCHALDRSFLYIIAKVHCVAVRIHVLYRRAVSVSRESKTHGTLVIVTIKYCLVFFLLFIRGVNIWYVYSALRQLDVRWLQTTLCNIHSIAAAGAVLWLVASLVALGWFLDHIIICFKNRIYLALWPHEGLSYNVCCAFWMAPYICQTWQVEYLASRQCKYCYGTVPFE